MYKSYVLIGAVAIIIIGYLGLVIPISATTDFSFEVPLIAISENGNGSGNGITGIIIDTGGGEAPAPEACTAYTFKENVGVNTQGYHEAFEVLKVFVPSCEEAAVVGCISEGFTGILAVAEGNLTLHNITSDGSSFQAWVLFDRYAVDFDGNVHECVAFATELPAEPETIAELVVSNQEVLENSIIIDKARLDRAGFVVIRADDDGPFGEVLGHTTLFDGIIEGFRIEIDMSKAGSLVHAMLYLDNGDGEFTADDESATVNGTLVAEPIELL